MTKKIIIHCKIIPKQYPTQENHLSFSYHTWDGSIVYAHITPDEKSWAWFEFRYKHLTAEWYLDQPFKKVIRIDDNTFHEITI